MTKHISLVRTDHAELAEKLALRAQVLRIAQVEPLRVLDLCAGEGVIWGQMRQRFSTASYTPCDLHPRMPGCITLDINDRSLNAFSDLRKFNVIDIDPFGDPWAAWLNLSQRITGRTVFFLTHGCQKVAVDGIKLRKILRSENGIPLDWHVPSSYEFTFYLGLRLLSKSLAWLDVEECLMGQSTHARYYGLICSPKENGNVLGQETSKGARNRGA